MKGFDLELEKDKFKDFCTEILPVIGNIEQILKNGDVSEDVNIRVGDNGYLSLEIYGSKWSMKRYRKDYPVRIIYEYSEEISVPDSTVLNRVSENLVEISLVFANLQPELRDGREIDSITWKQEFVVWANEFEQVYGKAEWRLSDNGSTDYLETIEAFAKEKIRKFAGLEE